MRTPLYLLAARDDEVVAPAQLFAAGRLVGTPAECLETALAPCRHIGLFIGRAVLEEFWPKVVRFMLEPGSIAPRIAEPRRHATPQADDASEPARVPAPHLIP